VKTLQARSLIDKDGNAYIKLADGNYHLINKDSGEIEKGSVYSGGFKGLWADGKVGPRTSFMLDSLCGRGATDRISFEEFRTVTYNLWDVSQVPKGMDPSLAGEVTFRSPSKGYTVPQDAEGIGQVVQDGRKKITVDELLELGATQKMLEAAQHLDDRLKKGSAKSRCLEWVEDSYNAAGIGTYLGRSGNTADDYAKKGGWTEVVNKDGSPLSPQQVTALGAIPGVMVSMANQNSPEHGHAAMSLFGGRWGSSIPQVRWNPYTVASTDVRVFVPWGL
jgi:hypothetical protein